MKTTNLQGYNPNIYKANNNSGRSNKRIALFGPTVTQDSIGNEIETMSKLREVWAKVITTKGSEYIEAAKENTSKTVRFIVHYSTQLVETFDEYKTKLEVHYKGSVYDVKSIINDDEMNKTFTIIAEGRL